VVSSANFACLMMCRLKITSCISASGHSQSVDRWTMLITCLAEETKRYCTSWTTWFLAKFAICYRPSVCRL